MSEPSKRVVVVGAGLAGLCCATHLRAAGASPLVLDASDVVGGRVRTDIVDGFRLDRGFQVLLTAYPEARRVLDYGRLDLRSFFPGALVRRGGKFHRLADPFRRPAAALTSLLHPLGSFRDKLRVAALRRRVCAASIEDIFAAPETTTLAALLREGFGPDLVEGFFRPFLGGVFLERELTTTSRVFEFVFRCFALGDAVIPAEGMGAIPAQLAARLPEGAVQTECRVASVEAGAVRLDDGRRIEADAVVVAVESDEAARLGVGTAHATWNGTTCLHFSAERPPVDEPILVLDGDGEGPVNNLCVVSEVAPSYAPPGAVLVSASVIGAPAVDDAALESAACGQLGRWFGPQVQRWRRLAVRRIPRALPAQPVGTIAPAGRPVRLGRRLFACGDYIEQASIQGALVSGRRAAEAVLAEIRTST